MEKKTYLILGISKGLGRAITRDVPNKSNLVFGVSRNIPDYLANSLSDVIQALEFIISTSKASCVKEINIPAMNDLNV